MRQADLLDDDATEEQGQRWALAPLGCAGQQRPHTKACTMIVAWALTGAALAVAVYQARWLKRATKLASYLSHELEGATAVITAYLRQGKGLRCEVCGNEMDASEHVDIVQQADGSFLVAHSSHQAHMWT